MIHPAIEEFIKNLDERYTCFINQDMGILTLLDGKNRSHITFATIIGKAAG